MGVYDEVRIRCPRCEKAQWAQSKSGPCSLGSYQLESCPPDVLVDVNRHAPFSCERCGSIFAVRVQGVVELL